MRSFLGIPICLAAGTILKSVVTVDESNAFSLCLAALLYYIAGYISKS